MSLLGLKTQFCVNSIIKNGFIRHLSVTPMKRIKQIQTQEEKNSLVISGKYLPSPNEQNLLKQVTEEKKFCLKCTLGLDVKHTDVLILSQYLRSDGCMLPRRITGLCKVQQKRMGKLVTMAQKAGLMPNIAPANSNKDPKKRFQWRKYNKYYDESTIRFSGRKIE